MGGTGGFVTSEKNGKLVVTNTSPDPLIVTDMVLRVSILEAVAPIFMHLLESKAARIALFDAGQSQTFYTVYRGTHIFPEPFYRQSTPRVTRQSMPFGVEDVASIQVTTIIDEHDNLQVVLPADDCGESRYLQHEDQ